MRTPTFSECRDAARAVRAAEFGVAATRVARPRGVLGIVRDRGPLTVMLYVAAREGRLVWQNANGFAMLEPPVSARGPLFAGGARLSLLRLLDRHWQTLVFTTPAAAALLAASVLLLVPPLWIVAAFLAVFAAGYVTVLMCTQLLWAGVWLYRFKGRGGSTGEIAAEVLPGKHWHLSLCHQGDPKRADELLSQSSTRMIRLVTARVRTAAGELGGELRDVHVTELLVCLVGGVTTTPIRDAVDKAAGVFRPYGPGAEVVIITMPDSGPRKRKRPFDRGGTLFYYLVGLAAVVAFNALLVANREGAAYGDALLWLAGRLVFSNLPDFTPVTGWSWGIGWFTSLAGLMALAVGFVAARRFIADRAHVGDVLRREVDEPLSQPKILILVVTQTERNAVLAAVHEANGEPASISPRGVHSVFNLGSLGGATILLAQSSTQGMTGPTGMMLTAASVIQACQPDYVILTGTCCGLWENEVRIGDVLVPQKVQDLDPKTVTDEGTLLQGEVVSPSPTLLDRFNAATANRAPDAPNVHFGLMLSSGTGLRSRERRREVKAWNPYAMGWEKEGAAVYAAAAKEKTDWIAVKGVSDFGEDMTWSSDNQMTAARNAADFVIHTIRSGLLQEGPAPDRRRGEKP